jgi:Na+-translocating ferredoxin:NAD+ oxidoreductase RnfG subunit
MKNLLINTLLIGFILNAGSQHIDLAPKQLNTEILKLSGCEKPVRIELKSTASFATDTSESRFYKYSDAYPVGYAYVGRVNTCRAGGCSAPGESGSKENTEFFDYFILFDSTARILSVQVFNYEATHGQEITVKSWLKQFVGYTADKELIAGKNIDAISGATISVHNICSNITDKTIALKNCIAKPSD